MEANRIVERRWCHWAAQFMIKNMRTLELYIERSNISGHVKSEYLRNIFLSGEDGGITSNTV